MILLADFLWADLTRAVTLPSGENPYLKTALGETMQISRIFVRKDAIRFFLQTWERTIVAWASLLHVATLPSNVPITDFNVVSAAQTIDSVIAGGTELPSRFGYVQFFNFVESLKGRMQVEKHLGFVESRSSVGNASHAYEIYRMAQTVACPLEQLRHWKRIGGRLNQLAGSALLLIVFSATADSFA